MRQVSASYDISTLSSTADGGSFVTRNLANQNAGQGTGITLGATSAGTPVGTVSTTIGSTGAGMSFSIMPSYYTLCYIMKA